MIITAHGGAMGTGRNTQRYFDEMTNYRIDAIEVDIRKRFGVLYLSHTLPKLFTKRAIKLRYVLEYCKKYNVKVNCDLKWRGLVKSVCELAKELGAGDNIYFTGTVTPKDIKHLDTGTVYLNHFFYRRKFPLRPENIAKIKEYLDSFNNPRIAGINIPYRYATGELINKAREAGLGLSIYTVDDPVVLKRLLSEKPDNITTNIIDIALKLREEIG